MYAYKESLLKPNNPFPVDLFIADADKNDIIARPHYHEYIELLYYLDGSAKQQSNNRFYDASKGDLFILTSGDVHSTFARHGEGCRILVIQFLPQIIFSGFSSILEYKYITPFLNYSGEKKKHLSEIQNNQFSIAETMIDMYNEFKEKKAGYELIVKGGIVSLIGKFIRNGFVDMPNQDIENKLNELLPVLKYIENNLSEDINLEIAASMANMSYYYFSRRFKLIMGKSFTEYINFVRVTEAERLILTTDNSISMIAEMVGYKATSALDKACRRIKGYRPSDLKRAKMGNY